MAEEELHIPEDVLMEILSRLPMKSLLRFRSVCKNWFSLIRNPCFVALHHNHKNNNNNNNNQSLLVVRSIRSLDQQKIDLLKQKYGKSAVDTKAVMSFLRRRENSFSLMEEEEEDDIDFDIWLPDINSYSHFGSLSVHGPFNGIVCIAGNDDDDDIVVLCNPATREFKTLPSPNSFTYPKDAYARLNTLGFGFDLFSSSNDYKVVRIMSVTGKDPEMEDTYCAYPQRVQIYNSSNDSWREILDCWREIDDDDIQFMPHYLSGFGILFKGAFHWTTGIIEDRRFESIFAFDIKDEVFRNIKVPPDCDEIVNHVFVLNDSLALIKHSPDHEFFKIWVMNNEYGAGVNESAWTKLFTIGPLLEIRNPLLFWNDSSELLLSSRRGQLLSCNLHTQQINQFPVYGCLDSLRVLPYTESLISFKDGQFPACTLG